MSVWKTCEKCKKKTKHLREFKSKHLCFQCYQKESQIISKGITINKIFNERLASKISLPINLTQTQQKDLKKRLKQLYGRRGLAKYVRGLILKDMYYRKPYYKEVFTRVDKLIEKCISSKPIEFNKSKFKKEYEKLKGGMLECK